MKVGIIADTHDNLKATRKAIEFFKEEKVSHVLHAGDLISPFTASMFSKLEADFHYVFGNNDSEEETINSKLEDFGADHGKDFKSLKIDGLNFALLHGTDEEIVNSLAKDQEYDVVVRGHTHEANVREEPLVINPGPASGYLADSRTVAIFETENRDVEIFEL